MTPKELIVRIIDLYVEARKPIYPDPRIFRGESHTISSKTEDLFAYYLKEKLSDDLIFYVNQTITTDGQENRIRSKPDIVITKGEEIKTVLDLKMDLGYYRKEFPSIWENQDKKIKSMREKEFRLYEKDKDNKRTQRLFNFSKNAKLFYVIISNQNIGPIELDKILKIQKEGKDFSDVFFLTEGIHPNSWQYSREDIIDKIIINDFAFDDLLKGLGEIIS